MNEDLILKENNYDNSIWFVSCSFILLYVLCYSSLISHHNALPMHDEASYVTKVYDFSHSLKTKPISKLINPRFYFNSHNPGRPPLLPLIAAFIVGDSANVKDIAFIWLGIRIFILLLSLYLLSHLLQSTFFILPALLIILSPPINWDVTNIYLVDHHLAIFCLFSFVMLMVDDRKQTLFSSATASLALFLPFMIKISSLMLLFPFCVIRIFRALIFVFSPNSSLCTKPAKYSLESTNCSMSRRFYLLFPWIIPYILLPISYLYFFYKTDYGRITLYYIKEASEGYWSITGSFWIYYSLISNLAPPWLILLFIASLFIYKRLINKYLIFYGLTGYLWLFIMYIFVFTYAYQDRYMYAVFPITVTSLLSFLCYNKILRRLCLFFSCLFFIFSLLFAFNKIPTNIKTNYDNLAFMQAPSLGAFNTKNIDTTLYYKLSYLSSIPVPQYPVPDSGFMSFCEDILNFIPQNSKTKILLVSVSARLDIGSAFMAQFMNSDLKERIEWDVPKLGINNFNLINLLSFRWFAVSDTHYAITDNNLSSYNLLQDVLYDQSSPLYSYFDKKFEKDILLTDNHIVIKDNWLPGKLALFERNKDINISIIIETLEWLYKKYTNEEIHNYIDKQIKDLQNFRSLFNFTGLIQTRNDIDLPSYCYPIFLGDITIDNQTKPAIMHHPLPDLLINTWKYQDIYIPKDMALSFSIALHPNSWSNKNNFSDGVVFGIDVVYNGTTKNIFNKYLDPKNDISSRSWKDYIIPLDEYSDKNIDIILYTTPGSEGNNNYDNALWSGLTLIPIVNDK